MVIFCNFKCLWGFSLFLESLTKRWTILEGSSFNNSSTPALHWLLNWSINFPFLAGNRQSPIDLRPTQVNNNKYKQLCIHKRDIQHQIWSDLIPAAARHDNHHNHYDHHPGQEDTALPLQTAFYDNFPIEAHLVNNGHTAKLTTHHTVSVFTPSP